MGQFSLTPQGMSYADSLTRLGQHRMKETVMEEKGVEIRREGLQLVHDWLVDRFYYG